MKHLITFLSLAMLSQISFAGSEMMELNDHFNKKEEKTSQISQESIEETFWRMEAKSMSLRGSN